MTDTDSTMSCLAPSSDTLCTRMVDATMSSTRTTPKTISVADAMNVPSTARMIRKRDVPSTEWMTPARAGSVRTGSWVVTRGW